VHPGQDGILADGTVENLLTAPPHTSVEHMFETRARPLGRLQNPATGADMGQAAPMGMTHTVVVMGVSGVGKTSVAVELARLTGWTYAEGDDFHTQANRDKMASGLPLDDTDRWPWLRRLAGWIGEREAAGESAVVTCSALKRSYRDLLRDGHPSVRFLHLLAPDTLIDARINARTGHYMPPTLLDSQLRTLEPLQDDEPGIGVDTAADPATVARTALDRLGIVTALDREKPT
jgi:gluconokinase